MREYLIPESGNWYKAGLHTHSTLSDGHFTPEQLKELYKGMGYSILALTDHRKCIPHPELNDPEFLTITSLEADLNTEDERGYVVDTVHINAFAKSPDTTYQTTSQPVTDENVNGLLRDLDEAGFVTCINHPVWSDMSTEELFRYHGNTALEIYNSISVIYNNYADDSPYVEHFLRAGGKATLIAADDCHLIREDGGPTLEYGSGFNMFRLPELSYDGVIGALQNRQTYASTGPLFREMWLDGNILHVECSPVRRLIVRSRYIHFKKWVMEDEPFTCMDVDISDLKEKSPYIWVSIRDEKGGIAWAQPYYFRDRT